MFALRAILVIVAYLIRSECALRDLTSLDVHHALACVLNTRGCPQAFYTAPAIHPVRVHKYPWQAS
jgi:hypothetical protein